MLPPTTMLTMLAARPPVTDDASEGLVGTVEGAGLPTNPHLQIAERAQLQARTVSSCGIARQTRGQTSQPAGWLRYARIALDLVVRPAPRHWPSSRDHSARPSAPARPSESSAAAPR